MPSLLSVSSSMVDPYELGLTWFGSVVSVEEEGGERQAGVGHHQAGGEEEGHHRCSQVYIYIIHQSIHSCMCVILLCEAVLLLLRCRLCLCLFWSSLSKKFNQ